MRCLRFVAVVLPAIILFLRFPENLIHAQFIAEDGGVFFHDAWEHGAISPLFEAASGYLHTLPRLVADLALLAPLERAPLFFNIAAFLIMLIPGYYLLSSRMHNEIPSFIGRVISAIIFAALPTVESTYGNMTNAQWYLSIAACLVFSSSPPARTLHYILDVLVLLSFSLSSPLGVILLPVAILRILRERRCVWLYTALSAFCIGILFQAIAMLLSPRFTQALPSYSLLPLVKELLLFGFFNAVLGVYGNLKFYESYNMIVFLLGLTAVIFLVVMAIRLRSRLLLILLYMATVIYIIKHAFPLPNQALIPDKPYYDTRYYLVFVLFTVLAAFRVFLHGGPARYAGAAILAPAILIGIPMDFSILPRPDTHYSDQVAVFRTLNKGVSFSFPTFPPGNIDMALTSKGRTRDISPLAGLQATPEPTIFNLEEPMIFREGSMLRIWGQAIDTFSHQAAGGLFVIVDERFFPAITGLDAYYKEPIGSFQRDIPIRELGGGLHDLSLIILSSDRKSYFQPTGKILTLSLLH